MREKRTRSVEKLISRPTTEHPKDWRRCTSGVGTLTRGSSPDYSARQLRSAPDFYKGLPAGKPPETLGRLSLYLQRRNSSEAERPLHPSSFPGTPLPARSHPLPGHAEPPALRYFCRCRAVGVRCSWKSPSRATAGLSAALPRTAPKEETRGGVALRASAAVPGGREPALRGLRRSAIPLPGRPVHLAGEGGRCQ